MVDEGRRRVLGGLTGLVAALGGTSVLGCRKGRQSELKFRELPEKVVREEITRELATGIEVLTLNKGSEQRTWSCRVNMAKISLSADDKRAAFPSFGGFDSRGEWDGRTKTTGYFPHQGLTQLGDLVVVDSPPSQHSQIFWDSDITSQVSMEEARISPDGKNVGVMYVKRQSRDLLTRLAGVLEVSTGRLIQMGVPHSSGPAAIPAVSDDGLRTVFTHSSRDKATLGLTLVNIYEPKMERKATEQDTIIRVRTGFTCVLHTAISRAGDKVAFIYHDSLSAASQTVWGHDDKAGIGIIDLTNPEKPRAKYSLLDGDFYCKTVDNMVFSADGTKIAFQNRPDTHLEDYVIDLRSGEAQVRRYTLEDLQKETGRRVFAKTSVARTTRQPPGLVSYSTVPKYVCE